MASSEGKIRIKKLISLAYYIPKGLLFVRMEELFLTSMYPSLFLTNFILI